ncbi:flagellar biosynthetic protein FliO [Alkalihalobacillus pseudalcaliphilus]|uniref:flagellar biosynthetic protein FliO n=1 Tax=Alkalihalobacillus pseudalcaliphilus TaxID=79884 RepID=UPI00064D96D0|nr:flagellar biosynthetic protein FliO [Alkalihalobacillus pseudalcaliphilus]KMK77228.1 hypothetical protein AB990_06680 [Alkalihalobacillus pseudalcaliphilus]
MLFRIGLVALCFSFMIMEPTHIVASEQDKNPSVSEVLELNQLNEEEQDVQGDVVEQGDELEEGTNDREEQELVGFSGPNLFSSVIRLLIAFAFIVVLIYFGLRFINKKTQRFQSSHYLQNLSGVSLGANRSVQIVRVGEKLLIVGVGDSIQLLKEVDDPEEIEKLLNMHEEQMQKMNDIPLEKGVAWLKGLTNKQKAQTSTKTENDQEAQAFKQLLDKQLADVSSSQKKLHQSVKERDKHD